MVAVFLCLELCARVERDEFIKDAVSRMPRDGNEFAHSYAAGIARHHRATPECIKFDKAEFRFNVGHRVAAELNRWPRRAAAGCHAGVWAIIPFFVDEDRSAPAQSLPDPRLLRRWPLFGT